MPWQIDDQDKGARVNGYLANERAFLAWIRTRFGVLIQISTFNLLVTVALGSM
jgi:uncharacterized membrane protein YidH (DUF202 family)